MAIQSFQPFAVQVQKIISVVPMILIQRIKDAGVEKASLHEFLLTLYRFAQVIKGDGLYSSNDLVFTAGILPILFVLKKI